jgi:hypothetical protein
VAAIISISANVKKVISDLGIDEIVAQLNDAEANLQGDRDQYTGFERVYRRYKDLSDDHKDLILSQITAANEGASIAAIERMHKIELVKNETYGGYLGEMRSARDDMADSEMNIKIGEARVRSLQAQLNMLASALNASATHTRAKTTANLLSMQAGALAIGQL